LKDESPDLTLCRTRFGRDFIALVEQTTERMNHYMNKIDPSAGKDLRHKSAPYQMKISRSVEHLGTADVRCNRTGGHLATVIMPQLS
jgi:hypothetical protein